MKETLCTYSGKWEPLGKKRKKCPVCGAELYYGSTHPVRKVTAPLNKRLLILSCSAKKSDVKLTKAINRYQSPAFNLLRKWLRENNSENTVIWIVSAYYGLIGSEKPIKNYDVRLTQQQINLLKPQKLPQQFHILNKFHFGDLAPASVFGHMPNDYAKFIDDVLFWKGAQVPVSYAKGRPGEKLQQLKNWLNREDMV